MALHRSDSDHLPLYVRQAAKRAGAQWVVTMPGGFQLMDASQAAEYVDNVRALAK